MHAVCVDVGLLRKNNRKLIAQNGYHKDINVTDLRHPRVTSLNFKVGFLQNY
jgi:hypothetical protein